MLNSFRVKRAGEPGVRDGYTVLHLTAAQERALFAATTQAAYAARQLEEAFYGSAGPVT